MCLSFGKRSKYLNGNILLEHIFLISYLVLCVFVWGGSEGGGEGKGKGCDVSPYLGVCVGWEEISSSTMCVPGAAWPLSPKLSHQPR